MFYLDFLQRLVYNLQFAWIHFLRYIWGLMSINFPLSFQEHLHCLSIGRAKRQPLLPPLWNNHTQCWTVTKAEMLIIILDWKPLMLGLTPGSRDFPHRLYTSPFVSSKPDKKLLVARRSSSKYSTEKSTSARYFFFNGYCFR